MVQWQMEGRLFRKKSSCKTVTFICQAVGSLEEMCQMSLDNCMTYGMTRIYQSSHFLVLCMLTYLLWMNAHKYTSDECLQVIREIDYWQSIQQTCSSETHCKASWKLRQGGAFPYLHALQCMRQFDIAWKAGHLQQTVHPCCWGQASLSSRCYKISLTKSPRHLVFQYALTSWVLVYCNPVPQCV